MQLRSTLQPRSVCSALLSDARYRKYTALVDRALASFDSVAEWADFVGALGRLEKIFSAPPPVPTSLIPRSLLLSKRLSQCLNPALPSGVHHRALAVYRQIFILLSLDGLRRDLPIWTPGLLPFFERANTSTRPVVLSLLEEFYLPLREDLKPTCRAFMLAVLPGLEEEGAENFDRTLRLLDSLRERVGENLFWSGLWAVVIANANVRQAAINFLVKRNPPSTELSGLSRPPAFLASLPMAVSSLLTSKDLLIVRGGLDLLIQHLYLDSPLYTRLPEEEQTRVMRSAVTILLRRELSLNRRLWGWLCGTTSNPQELRSEEEEKEVAFFETYGLHILKRALLEDMVSQGPVTLASGLTRSGSHLSAASTEEMSSRQRPYRIFLSLLDKWAVGAGLTSALALDSLRALQWQVEGCKGGGSAQLQANELLTTAGTLFDAFDKAILARSLLAELEGEVDKAQSEGESVLQAPLVLDSSSDVAGTTALKAIESPATVLLQFIVGHFTFKDDLSKTVHLPNLAAALLVLVARASSSNERSLESLSRSIDLCRLLFSYSAPRTTLSDVHKRAPPMDTPGSAADLMDQIRNFYADSASGDAKGSRIPIDLYDTQDQSNLLCFTLEVATAALQSSEATRLLIPSCRLLTAQINRLEHSGSSERVFWQPQAWLELVVVSLSSSDLLFANLEAIVTAVLAATTCGSLDKRIRLAQHPSSGLDISALLIINCLIQAMGRAHPPSEASVATQLLWQVNDVCEAGLLPGRLVAGLLAPSSSSGFASSSEGFASIWRFSDDQRLQSAALSSPLFCLLDMLSSDESDRRQAAESWLRSHLRSYTPLLVLLYSSIISAGALKVRRFVKQLSCASGLVVEDLCYQDRFDHEVLNHTLARLAAVARYGAAGFIRGAKTSVVTMTSAPQTHLDSFIDVALLSLRTGGHAASPSSPLFKSLNAATHSMCIDFLQTLAARGGLVPERLQQVEQCLVDRLLVSIARHEASEHHKLLLILHTVVIGKTGGHASPKPHPHLLQTIDAAIASDSTRPSLAHWVDFIVMTASIYRQEVDSFLIPLGDCICTQLRRPGRWIDMEELLLLNALEKAAMLSLSAGKVGGPPAVRTQHESVGDAVYNSPSIALPLPVATAKSGGGTSGSGLDDASTLQQQQALRSEDHPSTGAGLLGYVSGIFGGDNHISPLHPGDHIPKTASKALEALRLVITTLHDIWIGAAVNDKVKTRVSRMLERLYRAHSDGVAETIVDCWRLRRQDSRDGSPSMQLLDQLVPSPQIVVTFLCDTVSSRLPAPGSARPTWTPDQIVTADTLLSYLEAYLGHMSPGGAAAVCPVVLVLVKDLLANSAAHKGHLFPALRCFTVLAERLIGNSAWEGDKKARRDLQETHLRLFDLCVLIAGREARDHAGETIDEKSNTLVPHLSRDIATYLAEPALPILRKLASNDPERVATSASNAVYYIIAPPLKTKARSFEGVVDSTVLALATEVSKVAGARKALRSCLLDAFLDARFFQMSAESGQSWCEPILVTCYSQDKGSFLELISRISVAASTNMNIFANRRTEHIGKAMNLRRLSFVLYAAGREHFLPQLPAILEKLVEILRGGVEAGAAGGGGGGGGSSGVGGSGLDLLRAEAYLCLRVMLCRFDSQHLATLWPLLITELVSLADQ